MIHIDVVQVPYLLQMLRVAMLGTVSLLFAKQVAMHGSAGIQHRNLAVIGELLLVFDAVCAFFAFSAVAVSAGATPLIPRIDVIISIRVFFTVSALCGITASIMRMASLARSTNER